MRQCENMFGSIRLRGISIHFVVSQYLRSTSHVKCKRKCQIYIAPFDRVFHLYQRRFTTITFPWLRPFTVSFLCEREPPSPRSTPWGAYRTHGCHIRGVHLIGAWTYSERTLFHQSPSSARYSFYRPTEGWKAESTCRQWGSNLPPVSSYLVHTEDIPKGHAWKLQKVLDLVFQMDFSPSMSNCEVLLVIRHVQ